MSADPSHGDPTADPPRTLPPAVGDLPPSARVTFAVLAAADDPLSATTLAERAQTPRRTVVDALAALRDAGLVERRRDVHRPNVPLYVATPVGA